MKLHIDLENCYGIKKLQTDIDLSKEKAFAIYAPNGAMKSSLAQTFQDVADKTKSKDRIFANRVTKRIISDGDTEINSAEVLVIRPYDEVLAHSEKTSTLLVNATLREEYEQLHADVNSCKEKLIATLRAQSGSKRDIEKEIALTFTKSDEGFITALNRIRDEVLAQKEGLFSDVKYDVVFDEKVLSVLGTKDFKTAIEDYITKLNELLDKSTYFKRGTFNYYNASNIAKSLAEHGFFKAQHTLNLVGGEKLEIANEKELEKIIAQEKEGISSDKELRKKFLDLEKLLEKNVTVREFQSYIGDHGEVLPELANMELFKEKLWKSYIFSNIDLYKEFLDKVKAVDTRRSEIEEQASKERTQWEEVIEIFNDRFFVPFKLSPKNRVSVILGKDPILSLGFTFQEGNETATIEKAELVRSLSTGEKKALYVLNIIFEVQVRRKANQKTLMIVDDIADSFDYRNKYAIIQYLKEISEETNFYQLILTHNFDFFRTINSRFVKYSSCFMATKNPSVIALVQAAGIQNIFVNDWKKNFATNARKRIATIPFIRNLIEFTKGDGDPDFAKLTSLLHWKSDSSTILQSDLIAIYNELFGASTSLSDADTPVVEIIHEEAIKCLSASDGMNLENKVVLSIAIRLEAEKFMIAKIGDPAFIASIKVNQSGALAGRFKKVFDQPTSTVRSIERVILMTPENIHLNSFMYEPIIDMSDDHLRKLYSDVAALT